MQNRLASSTLAFVQATWQRWSRGWSGPWRRRDIVLLLLCPLLGAATALVAERIHLRNHVMPGVEVEGTSLAGFSRAALQHWIEQQRRELSARVVTVQVAESSFPLHLADIGVELSSERLVDDVLARGRTGAWWSRFRWRVERFTHPDPVRFELRFDVARWESRLVHFEQQVLSTPREGAVHVEQGQVVRQDPAAGQRIEREGANAALLLALTESGDQPVVLPLRSQAPATTKSAVESAEQRVRQLLARPLHMSVRLPDGTVPEETVSFTPDELGPAVRSRPSTTRPGELDVSLDASALDELLAPVRQQWEQPAKDAVFRVDFRQRVTIESSQPRTRLHTEHAEQRLWSAARQPSRRGVFEVVVAEAPRITTELAHSLRIEKPVAQFTTHHRCCRPRVRNIHRIADLVDGTVVLPGETFSLNERVGPRTAKNGFAQAPTIVHGEMSDTFGGGISQFATTLYNAVFDAGYQIIERQAHSYYFPRYPLGHEATLSYPKPDLIFRNDTRSGLLITTEYGATYIRVRLFGDNEGRTVRREVSERFDFVEPPIEYEVNDELTPGEVKVKRRGSRGFSVLVSRILTDVSGQTTTERRKVIYQPRVRTLAVHSCEVPKGEPGYTGKPCPEPEVATDAGTAR